MHTVTTSITLVNPETHASEWIDPGDVVPDWAVPLLDQSVLVDLSGSAEAPAGSEPKTGNEDSTDDLEPSGEDEDLTLSAEELQRYVAAISNVENVARDTLLEMAAQLGLEAGTDFPHRASREVIAQAMAAQLEA